MAFQSHMSCGIDSLWESQFSSAVNGTGSLVLRYNLQGFRNFFIPQLIGKRALRCTNIKAVDGQTDQSIRPSQGFGVLQKLG